MKDAFLLAYEDVCHDDARLVAGDAEQAVVRPGGARVHASAAAHRTAVVSM